MEGPQAVAEPRRWFAAGKPARLSGARTGRGAASRSPTARAGFVALLVAVSVPQAAGITGLVQSSLGHAASVIAKALSPSAVPENHGKGASVLGCLSSGTRMKNDLRGGNLEACLAGAPADAPGPTMGLKTGESEVIPLGMKLDSTLDYAPFHVEEGPLAETMRMIQTQEHAMRVQVMRCRAALQRLAMLQRFMAGRGGLEDRLNNADVHEEIAKWKSTTFEMQRQLSRCFNTAGNDFAALLGTKSATLVPMLPEESSVTPSDASEIDDDKVDGPSIRKADGRLSTLDEAKQPKSKPKREKAATKLEIAEDQHGFQGKEPRPATPTWSATHPDTPKVAVVSPSKVTPDVQGSWFADNIEKEYRVGTYHGCAVYGSLPKEGTNGLTRTYPADSELHLVWDIDQSKLVGEGTNDVELVIKCVLWWQQELAHDPTFIPRTMDEQTRQEFVEYCDAFDLEKAFRSVMHLLVRPGAAEFIKRHPQAKWWTFTNKDREQEGQVIRDVSDVDGLVGMYQLTPHEISGRKVVDANKLALQVLDREACRYLGIQEQERPLIGVRGQRKDLGRVAKLIREKLGPEDPPPVTIALIDDRKCDAWGNCQCNDQRLLCHIPAYHAGSAEQGKELVELMEKILPTKTLLKFYEAFKDADPTHALIQCVDIMSDDQSALLKKLGGDVPGKTHFEYMPRVNPGSPPGPLPNFERVASKRAGA